MDLSSNKVFDVLRSKKVAELYHANTVLTACTFLQKGMILSRGNVEREKLFQTSQSSDAVDKKYGIWFDAFVDSVDIHARARKRNIYGPVIFVIDSEIIQKTYTGKIWVSKLNPTKWAENDMDDRWFKSIDDLSTNFVKGRFDQMILFRHSGGALPFKSYLKKIILDDPFYEGDDGMDVFSSARGALQLAMTLGGFDVPIEKRKCESICKCKKEYASTPGIIDKLFEPKRDD
jgi:hypothetical protein